MLLSVHIVANAKRSEIMGWEMGALKLRIAAPAVEGKANKELLRFLGEVFEIAPSTIELEKGLASKKKRVRLPMAEADVRERVEELLKS